MPTKKTKGQSFERSLCCQLSLWWTRDDPEPNDAIFWRTAGSGARATTRAKKGKNTSNHHGDITATDPIGKPLIDTILLELKKGYSRSTIADILDAPEHAAVQQYQKWIDGLKEKVTASGSLHWMLIVQRDRRKAICYMDSRLWDALWTAGSDLPVMSEFSIRVGGLPVYALPLHEFLEKVSRQHVEAVHRGKVK